jgi:sugar/nucleoside kinase (ribokinase family)
VIEGTIRPMKSLATLGDVNLDIILGDMEKLPALGHEIEAGNCIFKPGGSAANVAMMLALNGIPVRFFGEVGRDWVGRFVMDGLQSYGLDVKGVAFSDKESTGVTVSLTYPGDRMYVTFPGTTADTTLQHSGCSFLQGCAHLHLASFFLLGGMRKQMGSLLQNAKKAGLTTSLDPGGDPSGTWDISDIEDYLEYVDFLLPNADEIRGLTAHEDLEGALSVFPESARCIVVKAGSEGAHTRCRGRIEHHRGFGVDVVDTTCAGDCFDAGFLYGWLRGEDIPRCVRWGNLFGAQAVSSLGLPDRTIDAFLREKAIT